MCLKQVLFTEIYWNIMASSNHLSLLTIIGVDFDLDYTPHFCRHYDNLGIDSWEVILQTNEKRYDLAQEAISFISRGRRCRFHLWDSEFDSRTKINAYNQILEGLEGWVLYADVDEFQEWPEKPKMKMKDGIVLGKMIDRFAPSFVPKELVKDQDIFEQFPVKAEFTKDVINAHWWKPCLFPAFYRFINSHDLAGVNYAFDFLIIIHHFKWTLTTKHKLQRRVERYRELGLHWKESAFALEQIIITNKSSL